VERSRDDRSAAGATPQEDPLRSSRDLIQNAFSVPAEQLDNKDVKVLAAGRAVSVGDLDPHLAASSMVLAQRTANRPRVLDGPEPFVGAARERQSGGRALTSAQAGMVAYALPISLRALAQSPSGEMPTAVSFEPVVIVLGALRFQPSSHRFEGRIAVALRNPNNREDRSQLTEPLQMLISADADAVSPSQVAIRQLGEPQIVQIAVAAPAAPFMFSARTLLDNGDSIEIPVEKSQLTVQPAQAVIDGLGLGKTALQIEVPGLQQAGPYWVSLSTTRGQIIPTPVQLDANGRASVQLRSSGTGKATITASGALFLPGTAKVRFAAPRNFIIAMLLGGLAGWIAKTRVRDLSGASYLAAMTSSCILSIAYAIGINWMRWAPQAGVGEALSFFVAATGAHSGVTVIAVRKWGQRTLKIIGRSQLRALLRKLIAALDAAAARPKPAPEVIGRPKPRLIAKVVGRKAP